MLRIQAKENKMKEYPSIEPIHKMPKGIELYTFAKEDGSNLRFEWNKKRGWYKYGTRTHLFDETDKAFGQAIPIFQDIWAEDLGKIAIDNKWEEVVVFCEFWGDNSIAGRHSPDDQKRLTLFDVNVYKKGILIPEEFLRLFGHLPIATYLGERVWDDKFLDDVRCGGVEGMSFEGVVGKMYSKGKNQILMYKAKSQAWINRVYEIHGEKGKLIVES